MKKVLCTSLVLLLIVSGISVAFAAESAKTTVAATGTTTTTSSAVETTGAAVTIVPDMTFTGTPISLTLDNAYKKMLADSPGAQMAELNRQSTEGVAKGYSETVHTLNESGMAMDSSSLYGKEQVKVNRAFATTQGPRNYETELNVLKTDTLKNYYTLKELENQVKIAIDNLVLKEKLLSNTQLKYKLGTVSKNDVLKAEVSVNEAKDQQIAALNGLNIMKMGFNQFMGYDLMQNVILPDTIKEVPLSSKSLKNSIEAALKNRNEIKEAAYYLDLAQWDIKNYKAFPKSSSKYVNAQIALLKAETSVRNAPMTVETDVRTKYMEMNQKYSAVQTGKKSVDNSKETVRLVQLQYDSGMATLSDVEEAQLGYYNSQLSYSKALLEYNLAVNAYELSSGVGIEKAKIQ
ncbi:MAG TPA: TolC family protein [Anaerovoracaceae bacterium]|nr:TolC family protein [Anaerovoracaceae bacterium]